MKYNLNISSKIFNSVYLPYLLDYSRRYEVYYGSGGSGKSVFIAQKLVLKALASPRRVLVIRKVAATQKDSCWQLVLDTLQKFKVYQFCKINKSTFSIEIDNGSAFLFKGLDEREKIKSIVGITDIWCEEATELEEEDATQLDIRLRAKAPYLQMFFSFNPVSKINWVYKRWFAQGVQPAQDTLILKTTYKDNRFLPPEYISAIETMKQTNYAYYCIYALGEFCSLDRLIYSNWKVSDEAPPTSSLLLVGLDFGYVNDPSALVISKIDEEHKKIYIIDEVYQKGLLNNQIAEILKYKGLTKEVIIADSAEQKSIEEIKQSGITRIKAAVKGQGSILQGIQKLQQYEILVSPNCPNVKIELENYSYVKDKKTGEYTNTPIDAYNHCLDALRYSLQCVESKQKLRTMNKALLGL